MSKLFNVPVIIIVIVVGVAGYLIGANTSSQTQSAVRRPGIIPKPGSIHVLYSLDRKQNDRALISLIDDAHRYIYFAVYEFTLSDVADALVRAKQRGVDVKGITDRENSTDSYEAPIISELREAGIPVETQQHPSGIMHIKALVTEKAYASGSYNWTHSATTENDEVLEIGSDPALRQRYEDILKELLADNMNASRGATSAVNSDPSTETIDYTQAAVHIGQTIGVTGKVVEVYSSKHGTTFFDYCRDYDSCAFSAVVFSDDKSKFGNLKQYSGLSITVSGRITTYQGRAEMVLRNPSQVHLTVGGRK